MIISKENIVRIQDAQTDRRKGIILGGAGAGDGANNKQ